MIERVGGVLKVHMGWDFRGACLRNGLFEMDSMLAEEKRFQ